MIREAIAKVVEGQVFSVEEAAGAMSDGSTRGWKGKGNEDVSS